MKIYEVKVISCDSGEVILKDVFFSKRGIKEIKELYYMDKVLVREGNISGRFKE